jgi:hypothetical protein
MRRWLCGWFGCVLDEHGSCCDRCGAWLYESDFVQYGSLEWIFAPWWWWRRSKAFVRHSCGECGKPIWFSDEPCCSEECAEKWVPF